MNIKGIQKLTLLDYPGRVACTLFTGGCNFRCPFCHNSMLVIDPEKNLSHDIGEIMSYLKKRRGVLEGVAITGGEPLLQPDIADFIRDVRALGYPVKLDTNGSRPRVLSELIQSGLVDYVAMDIKNSRERYGATIGIPDYDTSAVEESARLLMQGGVEFEFRTTVTRQFHEAEDFVKIGKWLCGDERFYLQQFKDSGSLIDSEVSGWDDATLKGFGEILKKYIPRTEIRGI
ncbi:MAG: anaerobic ribonucleoside-triphosphate reductase activating protein [Ruminococcaceae bacterium]|nr:anaerobic ribonucleoside-triphosphate reductase activating protein [Oscillospiraceae bacterium]